MAKPITGTSTATRAPSNPLMLVEFALIPVRKQARAYRKQRRARRTDLSGFATGIRGEFGPVSVDHERRKWSASYHFFRAARACREDFMESMMAAVEPASGPLRDELASMAGTIEPRKAWLSARDAHAKKPAAAPQRNRTIASGKGGCRSDGGR